MRNTGAGRRRRVAGVGSLALVVALSACYIAHPRFGAGNFERAEDFKGLPTYRASGSIGLDDKPEPVAAKVIQEACPTGHPHLVSGQAIATEGQDRYGFPTSGKWWTVTFTCDEVIPPD